MKTIMLWGGAAGFLLVAVAGLAASRPLDLVLRDAAAGCLLGAWLLRWWWTKLERALTDTMEMRRQAAEAAAEAEAAAKSGASRGAMNTPAAPKVPRRDSAPAGAAPGAARF